MWTELRKGCDMPKIMQVGLKSKNRTQLVTQSALSLIFFPAVSQLS